jgi:hypothetical protein
VPGLFVLELVMGGPLGVYAGVPLRYPLYVGTCLSLGVGVLLRARVDRAALGVLGTITAFLIVQITWATLVPIISGGVLSYGVTEVRAMLVLIAPILAIAFTPLDRLPAVVRALHRLVVFSAAVLALFQVVIWILGTLYPLYQIGIALLLRGIFGAGVAFMYVGPMPDGFFRVFWISSLWHLIAFFWIPGVVDRRWVRYSLEGLSLLAIMVTYSRGIWLGLLMGVVVRGVVRMKVRQFGPQIVRASAATLAVGVLVVTWATATGQADRFSERFTSSASAEDAGVTERVEQVRHLTAVFAEHPVLGGGYGAYAKDYIRSDEAPFSYENMPAALLAKLGLVGLALSLSFVGYWTLVAWRRRWDTPQESAAFLGCGVAVSMATATNPMLINFIGIAILSCLLLDWTLIAAGRRLDDATER